MKELIKELLSFKPFLSKKGSLVFRVPHDKTQDQFGDQIDSIIEPLNETCYRVPDSDIVTVKNISASAEDIFHALDGGTSKEDNQKYLDGLTSEVNFN